MATHPIANIGKAARAIARNYRPGPTPGPGKPSRATTRPYTRAPKAVIRGQAPTGTYSSPLASLRTLTPTITGTGVTTAHGPGMPGAPGHEPIPTPRVKPINFNTADPNEVVQAELAPEYASIQGQENQSALYGKSQQAAITGFGLELAKILQGGGGTLKGDYAAALSMQALRNFTYEQFLNQQKYADARAEVAAKAPTLYNQELARRDQIKAQKLAEKYQHLDYALKAKALDLQAQAYGLKAKSTNAGIRQSDTRNALSLAREQRIIAQYNQGRQDQASQIDVSASKAAGRWISKAGAPLNLPFANPIKAGTSKPKKGAAKDNTQLTKDSYKTASAIVQGTPYTDATTGDKKSAKPSYQQALTRMKKYLQLRGVPAGQRTKMARAALASAGYTPGLPEAHARVARAKAKAKGK